MELIVARSVLDRMLVEAAAAHPYECCGLLLGTRVGGERIDLAVPTRNVAEDSRQAFEIDPVALIEAFKAEREGGPEVVGYYHSHPFGTSEPSAEDRAQAPGDGRVWGIVAAGKMRFWRDVGGDFEPLSYEADRG